MGNSYTGQIEDTSEQAGRIAGYADRAGEVAKDYVAGAAERLSAVAQGAFDHPERLGVRARAEVTRYAQEKPFEALLVTAALGFALGALWRR